MSAEGIEPSTNGLKGRCSAIELRARDRAKGILTRGKVSVNGKPCALPLSPQRARRINLFLGDLCELSG